MIPFGAGLFFIFISIFTLFAVEVSGANKKHHPTIVGFCLMAGLLLELLGVMGFFASKSEASTLLREGKTTYVYSIIYILHFVIGHFLFVKSSQSHKIKSTFYILELIFLFLGLVLIKSDSLFFYPIYLLFIVLLISVFPGMLKQDIFAKSLSKGLIYAISFFVIFSGSLALISYNLGSIYLYGLIEEIKEPLGPVKVTFFVSAFFCFFSLLFIPQLSFFDDNYEEADSWLLFSLLRSSAPLLGSILFVKWYWHGEASQSVSEQLIHSQIVFALLLLFLLQVLGLFKTQKIHRLVSCVLLCPLVLGLLLMTSDFKNTFVLGVFCFLFYIFSNHMLAMLFEKSKFSLKETFCGDSAWQRVGLKEKHQILFLLAFSLPIANPLLLSVIKKLSLRIQLLPYGPYLVGLLSFLVIFALLGFLKKSSFFLRESTINRDKSVRLSLLDGLKIPLIVLGIFSEPLYTYAHEFIFNSL